MNPLGAAKGEDHEKDRTDVLADHGDEVLILSALAMLWPLVRAKCLTPDSRFLKASARGPRSPLTVFQLKGPLAFISALRRDAASRK